MQVAEKLVRKQFLIYPQQIKKLELLAREGATSASEMLRKSIDAYNPDLPSNMNESELLELLSEKVKEAITITQKTRRRLGTTFKKFEKRAEQ